MRIQSYNDMQIHVNWASPWPGQQVREAMDMTMKRETKPNRGITSKTLKFLFEAEHSSLVEHAAMSFTVSGISRSLLTQLTRHRLASYTSASQHYQDYSDYPFVVHSDMKSNEPMEKVFAVSEHTYKHLLKGGLPKEEARQVLTNAKAVNLMVTMNVVSLYNMFRKRMCLRNVAEMVTFINKLWFRIYGWWPELSSVIGPPCHLGECNQGHMTCGKEFIHPWKE